MTPHSSVKSRMTSLLYRPIVLSARAVRPLCQAASVMGCSLRRASRIRAKVSRAM